MPTLLAIVLIVAVFSALSAIPSDAWAGIGFVAVVIGSIFILAYILRIAVSIFKGENPFR